MTLAPQLPTRGRDVLRLQRPCRGSSPWGPGVLSVPQTPCGSRLSMWVETPVQGSSPCGGCSLPPGTPCGSRLSTWVETPQAAPSPGSVPAADGRHGVCDHRACRRVPAAAAAPGALHAARRPGHLSPVPSLCHQRECPRRPGRHLVSACCGRAGCPHPHQQPAACDDPRVSVLTHALSQAGQRPWPLRAPVVACRPRAPAGLVPSVSAPG